MDPKLLQDIGRLCLTYTVDVTEPCGKKVHVVSFDSYQVAWLHYKAAVPRTPESHTLRLTKLDKSSVGGLEIVWKRKGGKKS